MSFENLAGMTTQVIVGQSEAATATLAPTSRALKNYAHMRIYRIADGSDGQEERFQKTEFAPCEMFEIDGIIEKTAGKRGVATGRNLES